MNNDAFINALIPLAVKYGYNNNVLPSLIIANAVIESSWGTTDLYGVANSMYNLKVDANWTGKCFSRNSRKVYKHQKDCTEHVELFKVYNSIEESVADYVSYLTETRRSERGPLLYENIIGVKDYKEAVYNLCNRDDYPIKRGINKSSIAYHDIMISIIEENGLYNIDKEIETYVKEYNMANKKRLNNNVVSKPTTKEEVTPPVLYRVRVEWEDQDSQILVTKDKNAAIAEAKKHPGYKVFAGEDGEIVFDQELNIVPEKKEIHCHPGKLIQLTGCPLYKQYTDASPFTKVTGTFYMYNAHVNNGRVRISKTNDPEKLNGKDISAILGCIDITNI